MNRHQAAHWAWSLLQRDDWCLLDTETTGLKGPVEICQIGILGNRGDVLLDCLVKPTIPISAGATKIHHITDAMVADAPEFPAIHPLIIDAVAGRDVVIYNAPFDTRVLRHCCQLHQLPKILSRGQQVLCAMRPYSVWVGEIHPYYGTPKWQALPGGDHSAIGDCKAARAVVQRMAASLSKTA